MGVDRSIISVSSETLRNNLDIVGVGRSIKLGKILPKIHMEASACLFYFCTGQTNDVERDVAQSIACPTLKRSVVGSILLSGPSCSLGYFPFQPVVHNWFIKGRGMYCSVYGKVHIKDPLLLIEKSSLCGGSGFPSKKCVNVTI